MKKQTLMKGIGGIAIGPNIYAPDEKGLVLVNDSDVEVAKAHGYVEAEAKQDSTSPVQSEPGEAKSKGGIRDTFDQDR